MTDGGVSGVVDERFARVRDVFAANLAEGADVGASFAVTLEGETVVDLWGGWADAARTRPWTENTIVNVYSTTKTLAALTALLMSDRGEVDLDAPIALYWPEFAAAGKERITTSHVLSHSAGLCGWTARVTGEDIYDWDKVTGLLAAQAPLWEPGAASGYHSVTQGFLIGEVVRRVSGRSLGAYFRDEIARPLGLDLHIGLPESEDHRVADLIPPSDAGIYRSPNEYVRVLHDNPPINPLDTRTRAWRAAEIPAANGHGNARAIARAHAILANGGLKGGARMMSDTGRRRALEPQVTGEDLVLGMPMTFGRGFGLQSPAVQFPNTSTMYWGGYGGSIAIIDMDNRLSMSFAMNKMATTTTGDTRAAKLAQATWESLALS